MKVVSIGRRSTNEVVIKDPLVSRDQHCLITEEDNGLHYIFDANSTNGTFVNGSRIPNAEKIRLHKTDVVRIGNTVLPWQSYFKKSREVSSGSASTYVDSSSSSGSNWSSSSDDTKTSSTTALQAIALILSLVGLGCIAYVAIKTLSWGIFGYAFHYTTALIGAGCCLIALVLAAIASHKEESDNTTMATIAEWISSTCLIAVAAFFIYWKLNPNFLNPLS